ncbi:MAG: hypothetical protein QF593_01165 [Nitrospinota bacterium]|nr:hypothetical protein [Nitrospinota bacterium]
MIRFLFYLVVGGVIYYALKGLFGGARRSGEERQSEGVDDEMQKCPECGTYFPLHMGVSKRVHREKLMFCGEECAARYARRGGAPAEGSGPPGGEE